MTMLTSMWKALEVAAWISAGGLVERSLWTWCVAMCAVALMLHVMHETVSEALS